MILVNLFLNFDGLFWIFLFILLHATITLCKARSATNTRCLNTSALDRIVSWTETFAKRARNWVTREENRANERGTQCKRNENWEKSFRKFWIGGLSPLLMQKSRHKLKVSHVENYLALNSRRISGFSRLISTQTVSCELSFYDLEFGQRTSLPFSCPNVAWTMKSTRKKVIKWKS